MKKYYILILTLSLVLSVFAFESKKETDIPSTESTTKSYYILKDYKGYLACYRSHSPEPFRIFEIKTDSLPENDQKALMEGITAHSQTELESLVSDYTS